MMSAPPHGRPIVVSGPSGSGKTTLVRRLFELAPVPLKDSVSATTRAPRPGERDGVDYYFLSSEEFERRRQAGEFLECFEVYGRGYWYGTLRREVAPSLAAGKWVVLEIDVQGALAVMREYPDAVSIFILPPPAEGEAELEKRQAELEKRLRERGTEDEAALRRRLDESLRELSFADRYRYRVVNDDAERAAQEIREILTAEERIHAR